MLRTDPDLKGWAAEWHQSLSVGLCATFPQKKHFMRLRDFEYKLYNEPKRQCCSQTMLTDFWAWKAV